MDSVVLADSEDLEPEVLEDSEGPVVPVDLVVLLDQDQVQLTALPHLVHLEDLKVVVALED